MIPRTGERPKTIVLKGQGYHEEGRAKAASTILPGHLLQIDPASVDLPGTPEIVDVHATEGGNCLLRIAKEDYLRGRTILDAYDPGDIVPYHVGQTGDVVMVRVADNFDEAAGTLLESAGDGTFQQVASGTALLELTEVGDMTGTGTGEVLLVRATVL